MKKIVLKKTVVANLSKDGMNALNGGCDYFTGGSGGSCLAMTCGCPTRNTCVTCGDLTCINCLPEVVVTP